MRPLSEYVCVECGKQIDRVVFVAPSERFDGHVEVHHWPSALPGCVFALTDPLNRVRAESTLFTAIAMSGWAPE